MCIVRYPRGTTSIAVLLWVLSCAVPRGAEGQSADSRPEFTAVGSSLARSIQDKARDFVTVKDYGAKCDGGITDDRVAIQAAIDAIGSGTLILPNGPACGVSAPGIFLYPANTGITLRGQSAFPPGEYSPARGGGLVAYAGAPPVALITNMAVHSRLENLYLDCNARKSAHALINVLTTYGIQTNVIAQRCSGDGMQIFTEGTPATTLTDEAREGSASLSVASVTNNRITFGQGFCIYIVVDYGDPRQESLKLTGVSGKNLRVTGTKKAHGAGATVRCHGSANGMHFDRYSSFANGGWGFRIIPGEDNNAIYWNNHSSNGNSLGGELWFGSVHKHYGGDYEGDGGPGIQLGLASGSQATHFMSIFPVGDMEESSPADNVISIVCDDSSQISAASENSVVFQTGAKACPTYPNGSSSTVYGSFIKGTGPGFWVRTGKGYVEILPGDPGEIRFLNAEHSLLHSVRGDVSSRLTSPSNPGTSPVRGNMSKIVSDTSGPACADNAICATMADESGSISWNQTAGLKISIQLKNHTLQAGPNTLTLNGNRKAICSHYDPSASIGRGYRRGGIFSGTLTDLDCWADDSQ